MRNSERNIDVLTFMFVFIICILMSSLQSFDTLLPYITIKCISPPSQTPLCCVYDGSRFRVLHQKQAFSLPSWQSG